jgi:hypothetical protein
MERVKVTFKELVAILLDPLTPKSVRQQIIQDLEDDLKNVEMHEAIKNGNGKEN